MLSDFKERLRGAVRPGSVLAGIIVCNKEDQPIDATAPTESTAPTEPTEAKINRKKNEDRIPKKEYKIQESMFTIAFRTPTGKSIYNILVMAVVYLYCYVISTDLIQGKSLKIGFELALWVFDDLGISLAIWIGMNCAALVVYGGFKFWATVRLNNVTKKWTIRLWNTCCILAFGLFWAAMVLVPPYLFVVYKLNLVSSAGLVIEQCRFLVKVYSFVRVVSPRVDHCTNHHLVCDCSSDIRKYIYYIIAPTLVYQDEYPKTPKFRFSFLVRNFLETVVIILIVALILERWVLPSLQDFTSIPARPWQFIAAIFHNILYTTVMLIILFYAFCHSGFNAVAEVTRFGDRLSYKDWWNATSYPYFYRTWNLLVQDWLFMRVYREAYNQFLPSRITSSTLVFVVSGVIHEYVAAVSLRCFYPIMLVMLVILGPFFVLSRLGIKSGRLGNLFVWSGIMFGTSMMSSFYIAEYYARKNCPRTIDSDIMDFLVPRSWTCSLP